MTSVVEVAGLQRIEIPWNQGVEDVAIGKDVLELLSSSMYVDPMSVYREYVQNAADAIDDARGMGLLDQKATGKVEIYFDTANRALRIRDNGTGIEKAKFERRMTAFGGSVKRGTKARGFRGVGRLAGIGYCQELIFRTRAAGEARASELKWDCRKIKSILRSTEFSDDLADLVRQVVTLRQIDGRGLPEHFFEVELRGLVRQRNDLLLDPKAIETYLAQAAPLPFSPSFTLGEKIVSELKSHSTITNLELHIEGIGQVYRPHQDKFEITEKLPDSFSEIEFIRIPAIDGALGAVGWILHHSYKGALPTGTNFRGLRLRVGNIQVGASNLLEELFPEPRFNSWSVGEVHILDPRVMPNGRRDHFEQNVHYLNLLNHLAPVAREISRRCRTSSMRRNWVRQFERHKGTIREKLAIAGQGSLTSLQQAHLIDEAREVLSAMERIAMKEALGPEYGRALRASLRRVQAQLLKIGSTKKKSRLSRMKGQKRQAYQHLIGLIYECSSNQVVAKTLVDRILARLK
jgi:Histidine kinase-, DNA gyrase B-, and HSP90-like ATPase